MAAMLGSCSRRFSRAGDAPEQVGDPAKARAVLDWKPTVTFADMVALMVEADLRPAATG